MNILALLLAFERYKFITKRLGEKSQDRYIAINKPDPNCQTTPNMWVTWDGVSWFQTIASRLEPRRAWVEWTPPQTHLHYAQLYTGICEYLRLPPSTARARDAERYLADLLACEVPPHAPVYTLQMHRIEWTRAWLQALWQDDGRRMKIQRVN